MAVPVLTYGELNAYATEVASTTVIQSALLAEGGSVGVSASQGSVSTAIQGAAIASGNGLDVDFAFTERLGAPHPTVVTYYDSVKGEISYLSTDMQAFSEVYGIFTLDAADVGYTYSMAVDFGQAGTSKMVLLADFYDLTESEKRYELYQYNTASTDGNMGSGALPQSSQYYSQIGSTSGDLIAGHTYSFAIIHEIGHYWTADGETAAEAEGTFTLAIQGPAPQAVPEPSGLVLCGLGLAGLLWAVRKRPVLSR